MTVIWNKTLHVAYKTGRKVVITVMGVTVILFGVILIFTPGPAFVFIPLGLAILGLEFAWARRWLAFLKNQALTVSDKLQQIKKRSK